MANDRRGKIRIFAMSDNLRDRSHNRNLLAKSASLSDHDFIIRMLYKDCY